MQFVYFFSRVESQRDFKSELPEEKQTQVDRTGQEMLLNLGNSRFSQAGRGHQQCNARVRNRIGQKTPHLLTRTSPRISSCRAHQIKEPGIQAFVGLNVRGIPPVPAIGDYKRSEVLSENWPISNEMKEAKRDRKKCHLISVL